MVNIEGEIPAQGPLSVLTEAAWTGVSDNLRYGGQPHLRKCYRIPIDLLHFNIENGRYRTKFLLLKKANPDATIDPRQEPWRREIFRLLNGTWEHPNYPVGTTKDRPYFIQLVEDIKERGQERPGIVLETGGVMSGNRRLAALLHLYNEQQNERFRYFEAFIVPSVAGVTSADIWHLEMAAQQAQARLTREYEPVERLLKIREGVECFEALNPPGGQSSAMRAVANDFGVTEEYIADELSTLDQIESYLHAIGHPEDWWLAEGKTEIFTEIPPLLQACETNAMSFDERSKLIRTIYHVIQNENADYRLIRDIRTTIGPKTRRRGARRMAGVTRILIENSPSTAILRQGITQTTKTTTRQLVDRFRSEFEAGREQEAPLTKAERAESNLRKLVEILEQQGIDDAQQIERVARSLTESESLVNSALRILRQRN
jgi:hypothetical protein